MSSIPSFDYSSRELSKKKPLKSTLAHINDSKKYYNKTQQFRKLAFIENDAEKLAQLIVLTYPDISLSECLITDSHIFLQTILYKCMLPQK